MSYLAVASAAVISVESLTFYGLLDALRLSVELFKLPYFLFASSAVLSMLALGPALLDSCLLPLEGTKGGCAF